MKKLVALLLSTMLLFGLTNFTFAADNGATDPEESVKENVNVKELFDQRRAECIIMELKEAGVEVTKTKATNLSKTMGLVEQLDQQGKLNKRAKEHINKLKKAEVVIMLKDGSVYSSSSGYLGQAEKVKDRQEPLSQITQENMFGILSQSDPTPSEIHGGTTGAFAREQLEFDGFDGIQADVTLPDISNIDTDDEQPWVYFGFEADGDSGIEAGLSYQTGNPRWVPYVKSGGYDYEGNLPFSDGDTLHVKSFITSSEYYLLIDYDLVLSGDHVWSDPSSVSVKRVTSIARDSFNGYNIDGESRNMEWSDTEVSRYNYYRYYPLGNFDLWSYWDGSKWYGTVDCTSDYIHRSGDDISIYES